MYIHSTALTTLTVLNFTHRTQPTGLDKPLLKLHAPHTELSSTSSYRCGDESVLWQHRFKGHVLDAEPHAKRKHCTLFWIHTRNLTRLNAARKIERVSHVHTDLCCQSKGRTEVDFEQIKYLKKHQLMQYSCQASTGKHYSNLKTEHRQFYSDLLWPLNNHSTSSGHMKPLILSVQKEEDQKFVIN